MCRNQKYLYNVCMCLNMFKYDCMCFDMFEYIKICLDMFRYAQICSNIFRYVQIRSDIFRYVQICLDIFTYVQICSDMFGYVQICSDMFCNLFMHYQKKPIETLPCPVIERKMQKKQQLFHLVFTAAEIEAMYGCLVISGNKVGSN